MTTDNPDGPFRLRLRDQIEAHLTDRRRAQRSRIARMDVSEKTKAPEGLREIRIDARFGSIVTVREPVDGREIVHAKRHMEEMIVHEIYGDVLDELRAIRLALYQDDLQQATDRLDRLMNGVRP